MKVLKIKLAIILDKICFIWYIINLIDKVSQVGVRVITYLSNFDIY